jgi:hypothetical protein
MGLRRRYIHWWLRRADSLTGFEHALVSVGVSAFVAGAISGWLGCYLFHHA